MLRMFTMQERIDKAIHIVRRASLAPVERDRESSDYDSGDQSELMRLCNTKRIAGVCIVLLAIGAVLLLMPANIRYVPLKDMPYCIYIGAGLGGLAFLLIALNIIWWKCALRPVHPKPTRLRFPKQPVIHTITNSYPFRYCIQEMPLNEISPPTPTNDREWKAQVPNTLQTKNDTENLPNMSKGINIKIYTSRSTPSTGSISPLTKTISYDYYQDTIQSDQESVSKNTSEYNGKSQHDISFDSCTAGFIAGSQRKLISEV